MRSIPKWKTFEPGVFKFDLFGLLDFVVIFHNLDEGRSGTYVF